MKTALIINGHAPYAEAKGEYNAALFHEIEQQLSSEFHVLTSVLTNGYDIKEEQEKFKQADLVVFQFPIYWFNVPGILKTYFDEVYEYGVFYGFGGERQNKGYGSGGLMQNKKYMFSVTFNAPESTFNDPDQFMEGLGLEQFLFNQHKTQQFCGMHPMKSFAVYNVVKKPNIERDIARLKEHMEEIISEVKTQAFSLTN